MSLSTSEVIYLEVSFCSSSPKGHFYDVATPVCHVNETIWQYTHRFRQEPSLDAGQEPINVHMCIQLYWFSPSTVQSSAVLLTSDSNGLILDIRVFLYRVPTLFPIWIPWLSKNFCHNDSMAFHDFSDRFMRSELRLLGRLVSTGIEKGQLGNWRKIIHLRFYRAKIQYKIIPW